MVSNHKKSLKNALPFDLKYTRSCDWSKIVDDGNEFFDRTLVPLRIDDYERISVMNDDLERELKAKYGSALPLSEIALSGISQRVRTQIVEKIVLGHLMPVFSTISNIRIHTLARTRLTYTTVLLAEYFLEHGTYPKELADLGLNPDSKWIIDPYTNQNFQYESPSQNTRYRLYALGPNRIDNHGKPFGEIGADDISPSLPNLDGVPINIMEPE